MNALLAPGVTALGALGATSHLFRASSAFQKALVSPNNSCTLGQILSITPGWPSSGATTEPYQCFEQDFRQVSWSVLEQRTVCKMLNTPTDPSPESIDIIQIDGAMRYLEDIQVQLDEVACMGICEMLGAPTMGQFTRENFLSGWRGVGPPPCDTIQRQTSHAASLRISLTQDRDLFKRVYRYAFVISRPEGSRNLPMDSALDVWKLFFTSANGGIKWNTKDVPWLDWWLDFYTTKVKRPVNKDLWEQTGELVQKTMEQGRDLSWWSEEGSWPIAVDEFVEYVKEKLNHDVGMEVDG